MNEAKLTDKLWEIATADTKSLGGFLLLQIFEKVDVEVLHVKHKEGLP